MSITEEDIPRVSSNNQSHQLLPVKVGFGKIKYNSLNNSIYSCGSRIKTLSKSFIDYHKKREAEYLQQSRRKRRIELYNLRFPELKALYIDIGNSYRAHLHYLNFPLGEISEVNGPRNVKHNRIIRSKLFVNGTVNNWGKREVEYYQVTDNDGNFIRRPLWIRVTTMADQITIFRRIYGLTVPNDLYADNPRLDMNPTPLRCGPIQRPDEPIIFTEPDLLDFRNRFQYHKPMYKSLDESTYVNKIEEINDEGIKTTKYVEHCLLSVSPAVRYIKKTYCKGNINYVELYDDDNLLIETERMWAEDRSVKPFLIADWNDIYFSSSYENSKIHINQELIVASGDVISTLLTIAFRGVESIVSLFIAGKEIGNEYNVTINGNNEAQVTLGTEQSIPEPAGTRVYKSALICRADNQPQSTKCLIEMIIPPNARVASAVDAAGKCRADRAIPVKIYSVSDVPIPVPETENSDYNYNYNSCTLIRKIEVHLEKSKAQKAFSFVYESGKGFEYEINKEICLTGADFDPALDDSCRPGIHYCLTKKEALDYHYPGTEISIWEEAAID